MRSVVRWIGPAFLAIGAVLLVDALTTGGARLYLLVIVPVFTGTSLLFGVSVGLLVVGFLLLPLAFTSEEPIEAGPGAATPRADESESGGSGGMVLIGPVPIFFGSWRRNPPISYRWAFLVGLVLAVLAVLLLWGVSVL
jgi:uncharacterized membrane protein